MEFKGSLGKKIITEETAVMIKQKSFLFGSYNKKIPYSKIQAIEISEPGLKAGYIRIVEDGDERTFDGKKGATLAANDDNSVILNKKKEYTFALKLKEELEDKMNSVADEEDEESIEFIGKRKEGKLKFFIIAIIAFVIIQCNIINSQKQTETKIPVYERFNMTETEYSVANEIFEQCGFSKITKVEKEDELNDGTVSYYIEMDGVEPNKIISPGKNEGNVIYVFLTNDHTVSEILVNNHPVYKNGNVLNQIIAFTEISYMEKGVCVNICENNVKKLLKSPSTAKFCNVYDYFWAKENGIIKARGFVDAQNSFGAMIRTDYLLTYDCVNKKPLTLKVNDAVYTFN